MKKLLLSLLILCLFYSCNKYGKKLDEKNLMISRTNTINSLQKQRQYSLQNAEKTENEAANSYVGGETEILTPKDR